MTMKLRMAHRILSNPRVWIEEEHKDCATTTGRGVLKGLRSDTVCVVADNVADYLAANILLFDEWMDKNHKGLINVAPPFPNCFIEANYPEHSHCPPQAGFFIQALDLTTPDGLKLKGDPYSVVILEDPAVKTPRWRLSISFLYTDSGGSVNIRDDQCEIFVAGDGTICYFDVVLGSTVTNLLNACKDVDGIVGLDAPDTKRWALMILYALPLMTLNFMNCKNVALEDITDEVAPPRKWQRRQRLPQLKYQTVVIDPNSATTRKSTGRRRRGQGFQARHICRGHFRTYTPENGKGLFGKYFGTFWIPAHECGDTKNGEIITTYDIKAPE